MSRSNATSHKANMNPSKPSGSLKAKGLKDIRVDEEVKIAVNIALERFQYSEQRGTFIPLVIFTEQSFRLQYRITQVHCMQGWNEYFGLVCLYALRDGVSFFTDQHRESVHTSPCTIPGLRFEKQRVSVSTRNSCLYKTKQNVLGV